MNIVITIAGASRRFAVAGIDAPKWSLPFRGKYVLWEVINGLLGISEEKLNIFLFCLEDQRQLVEKCLTNFQYSSQIYITTTEKITGGQAFSAANCIKSNSLESESVLIAPGDMIFKNLGKYGLKSSQNWMALANLPGDNWSFAQLADDGTVIKTAEKKRISPFASVGLYHFKSGGQFLELINHGSPTGGEYYVAPLYNRLVEIGEKVDSVQISLEDFIDVGTPQAYYENLSD
jgi:dTDP-glucose pyrophosphorylase